MAPKSEDEETRRLAAEVARLADESEDEAVREALRERCDRLEILAAERRKPEGGLIHFLETEVWPLIPEEERDQSPMSKAEREEILGYGPEGV